MIEYGIYSPTRRDFPERLLRVHLRESRRSPVNPLSLVEREGTVGLHDVRVGALVQKELANKRVEVCLLAARELAVVVVADLREAHRVGLAECLVDLLACAHASVRRLVAEPLHGRVLDDEETAGCNERRKLVVVDAQLGHAGGESARDISNK